MPDDALHSPKARPYRADAERSYVLPPNYYIDPAVYEREKREIFYKAWNYAGHVSQLANVGDYVTCRVADQELFVIRSKDERLRAFYNVCAHRAHQLLKGCGSARVITCPYHAWSYHADGRLRTARGTEHVAEFNPDDFHLKEVGVEMMAGFVYVNLDPDARQPEEPDRRPGSGDAALPAGTAEPEVLAPADLQPEGQLEERRRQFHRMLSLPAGASGFRRDRGDQAVSHQDLWHLLQPHLAAGPGG